MIFLLMKKVVRECNSYLENMYKCDSDSRVLVSEYQEKTVLGIHKGSYITSTAYTGPLLSKGFFSDGELIIRRAWMRLHSHFSCEASILNLQTIATYHQGSIFVKCVVPWSAHTADTSVKNSGDKYYTLSSPYGKTYIY